MAFTYEIKHGFAGFEKHLYLDAPVFSFWSQGTESRDHCILLYL